VYKRLFNQEANRTAKKCVSETVDRIIIALGDERAFAEPIDFLRGSQGGAASQKATTDGGSFDEHQFLRRRF
jgi:hypothetical protein